MEERKNLAELEIWGSLDVVGLQSPSASVIIMASGDESYFPIRSWMPSSLLPYKLEPLRLPSL